MRPPLFDNYSSDFNDGNALSQADDTLHDPNLPQKTFHEQLLHPSDPNIDTASDTDAEEGKASQFSWFRREHDGQHVPGIQDGHKLFIPSLESKTSDDDNDFRAHLGVVADSQVTMLWVHLLTWTQTDITANRRMTQVTCHLSILIFCVFNIFQVALSCSKMYRHFSN